MATTVETICTLFFIYGKWNLFEKWKRDDKCSIYKYTIQMLSDNWMFLLWL